MGLDKKQMAALAGVIHYLKAEKKRLLDKRNLKPYCLANRWSMYGRRTIMQLRSRVQRGIPSKHMPLPFVSAPVSSKGTFPHRVKNLVISRNRLVSQARIRTIREVGR